MQEAEDVDLATLGCEIGRKKTTRLDTAIRATFALMAMITINKAGAQGGACLTNCGDHELPPIVVTPGGPGPIGTDDPCPGGSCGPGNDVPPDQGGAPTAPPKPTPCEIFLKDKAPPLGCKLSVPIREPRFGSGCNFTTPVFMPMFMAWTKHFKAACDMQMQCYWTTNDKTYCDDRVRQEAYAGCATVSTTTGERANCVDKAESFVYNMAEDAKDMNMMTFDEVRASVACTRWKGEYNAVCR